MRRLPNSYGKRKFLCIEEKLDRELVIYGFRCVETGLVSWRLGGSGQFDVGTVYPEERIRKFPPTGNE